jgi:DNA-binding beta-propeller fold protein YncE
MTGQATHVAEATRLHATNAVRNALAAVGRTEDVRFAPSGRRLAIACFGTNRIAVADVELGSGSEGFQVLLSSIELLEPAELDEPHGMDFVDEDTLAVANRAGGVIVLRLPPAGSGEATSIGPDDGGRLPDSPGSIAVRPLESGEHEVLTCNNWSSTITRHTLVARESLAEGEVIVRKRLDLPDGLALSSDARWLAVSNHNSHTVLVYAYGSAHEESEPVGVLRGVKYPHGLRFYDADRFLLVADAGAPYVHDYEASGGWRGARFPVAAIRVMDEETFARGHRTPEEGGPKGLDVEDRAGVLVVTSEHQPLAFFDLSTALDGDRSPELADALVRYELDLLSEADTFKAKAEKDVASAGAQLAEILGTKAWRITAPIRRLNAVAHRARRRSHGT